ncbi:YaaC family protein [Bacillus carboniphilus]|uniref:YaaC family protein n=1 Tax=Bacillus carboniphilus TaxID=86663 RepID=A0ABY9JTR7_9BACI|nr:YaaC family protein [Bacillus carboniphilus]WLR41893.1 YaaC family protein [Bacillus carboniphilus]
MNDEVWNFYKTFYSSQTVQQLLYRSYKRNHIEDKEKKSFDNCYSFIYYLEHAENFFKQSYHSPITIQPILSFYGLTQLLKAIILTVDPFYPASSTVLAHGVSTRKKKKQNYCFLKDEVKIQKNGLFSHLLQILFHMKHCPVDKISMKDLLIRIPELEESFFLHNKLNILIPLEKEKDDVFITNNMANQYHMSLKRLNEYLSHCNPSLELNEHHNQLYMKEKGTYWNQSPFLWNMKTNEWSLPHNRESLYYFPEILVHYLVLYNLSMIARYDTEWWYELNHHHDQLDLVFISEFLFLSNRKIPFLVMNYLKEYFI